MFPDLDSRKPERLTLPLRAHAERKATITYEYIFVPPKGC